MIIFINWLVKWDGEKNEAVSPLPISSSETSTSFHVARIYSFYLVIEEPKFNERGEGGEKNWLKPRHIVHSSPLTPSIHPSIPRPLCSVTPPKDDGVGPSPRHCPSIQPFPLPSSFTLSLHGTRARFSMVHLAILYGPGIYLPFDPLGLRQSFQRRFLRLLVGQPARLRQRLRLLSMIDRSLGEEGGEKKCYLATDPTTNTFNARSLWGGGGGGGGGGGEGGPSSGHEKAWKILYYLRADRLLAVDRRW